MLEYSDGDGSDYEDFDEDVDADSYGDDDEDSDADSGEDVPLDVLLPRLVDSDANVRVRAVWTLGDLGPVALGPHADALVERLEDADVQVRKAALLTLCKLEPTMLAQYASAVAARLKDPIDIVRDSAFDTLSALPRYVTRGIDFASKELRSRVVRPGVVDVARPVGDVDGLGPRLLGRLGWYRCRLRLRVRSLALYWYALPYRPSGPGHARDLEAWDRMSGNRDQSDSKTPSTRKRQKKATGARHGVGGTS